jgi:hypothetical protein
VRLACSQVARVSRKIYSTAMSIGLVTKSIHTLLILTLELLDEVVETVVVEDLVSTVRDSGDHGTGWRRTVWGCAWKAGRAWRMLERRLSREFWEDCGRV